MVVVVVGGLVVVVVTGGGALVVVVVVTAVVVVVVVVVVVLEEEDGADDELDATVCDGASDSVGISEGVLISETRAGLSLPGPAGSPDASDPTSGAST
ncbi:hypothetical protein SK854_18220 [Lentzea sp. BCCO 10_0061]|uniref:Secreted protein n=1 Tax=Lentzea sokolovensis TaxID=3095429 RepID=A0ABU4UXU8_9PSEU|nr:hypothetical protein [Lentzea sp. BCCO 10_0061]MDX8144060.1 hypothetical protein [Lentzea sp. BCCO 10_0061]